MVPSRYARKSGSRKPIKFYLAFEGAKTEYKYFNSEKFKLFFRLENIEIISIERKKNDTISDPEHIIRILDDYRREQKLKVNENDIFCIIIDYDNWGDKKLASVLSLSRQKEYKLYVSNPCIELWFVLHKRDVSNWQKERLIPCRKCKQLFSKYFNGNYERLYPFTQNAITNAKKLNNNNTNAWPLTIGTDIYRLIEQILSII